MIRIATGLHPREDWVALRPWHAEIIGSRFDPLARKGNGFAVDQHLARGRQHGTRDLTLEGALRCWVELAHALDRVPKELDPDRSLAVGREHVDDLPAHGHGARILDRIHAQIARLG